MLLDRCGIDGLGGNSCGKGSAAKDPVDTAVRIVNRSGSGSGIPGCVPGRCGTVEEEVERVPADETFLTDIAAFRVDWWKKRQVVRNSKK